MSREQECSAVQGSGSLTRCVVQKLLPSVARPAFLRHIAPQASSRKWPDLPKPLPLGATATTAASGGNREELLGPRPAGCERQRSRRWEPQPGQWHAAGVTERASQLRQSRHTAMSRLFCQSDTIAVLSLLCQRPCPLRRFAPALPKGEPFRTPHRTARSR